MTFDPERPVQTRDGRKAQILCHDLRSAGQPIAARILFEDGGEDIVRYRKDGKYSKTVEDCIDLVNIPEEHEMVVYLLKGNRAVTVINSPNDTIASRRIRFKEGEFAD